MKLIINFAEPDMMHPDSDVATVYEIAMMIENKYHLVDIFAHQFKSKIAERFSSLVLANERRTLRILEEDVKNWWREFILDELHKIRTSAAKRDDRESFVASGTYYRNMRIKASLK